MIVSQLKPMAEILRSLEGEARIFLVGCHGCAQASGTGGHTAVRKMQGDLEQAGKTITGATVVDFLCDRALTKYRLSYHADAIIAADSLLVMTCGIGVQATAAVVDKVTHPACNTLNLGGAQGEWAGSERCHQCGDCLLDYTGGICPLTACTKSLLNGQCGGAKNGMCEFEPDIRPCGWHLIYERVKRLGRLDKLKELVPAKDYSKMFTSRPLRSTIMWALEQEEKGVALR